jgi:hypothetical protein
LEGLIELKEQKTLTKVLRKKLEIKKKTRIEMKNQTHEKL